MNASVSSKPVALTGAIIVAMFVCVFGLTHLGYFADINFLGAIFFLQLIVVALWKFERIYFPILMLGFLWAGLSLPLQGAWTMGRWPLLAVGALGGFVVWMKRRTEPFRMFHLVAALCVLAALVSAMVSAIPPMALSKAASLFLLFLYGAAGMRVAVLGREERFFRGLLLACETLVYITAVAYLGLGARVFGNQNSLGVAMGVGVFPILFWGWISSEPGMLRRRRLVALLISVYLVHYSFSRAAIIAAGVVTLVLCFCLREYKILIKAVVCVVCMIAVVGVVAPSVLDQSVSDLSDAVIYKGHKDQGLLGSRQSPWEETVAEIKKHPFFGSGFGTSPTEENAADTVGSFSSSAESNREHGSSYLALTEWVGLLGLLPFVILLVMVVNQIVKTILWLRQSGNSRHYAVPLALVLLAGLVHAIFEDWLFAVGSYSSIYFWSLAFVLVDLSPVSAAAARFSVPVAPARFDPGFGVSLPSR
jgi:O-antigen ligase